VYVHSRESDKSNVQEIVCWAGRVRVVNLVAVLLRTMTKKSLTFDLKIECTPSPRNEDPGYAYADVSLRVYSLTLQCVHVVTAGSS